MSRNWDRVIQVVFDSREISSDDFDIEFSYSFDTDEEPNEIEVLVKNLATGTINQYIKKDKLLIVNAGYRGDVGSIARGFIVSTATAFARSDKDTEILGVDASEEYLDAHVSKAYKPGIKASEIIADLMKQTGLTIGEINLATDVQYSRGRSVIGKLRTILKDIVTNDCKTNIQIVNGVVMIRTIGQGLATGFVLSATTGLIGSPEPLSDTSDTPADKRADYIISCQLNHRIRPMTRLRIDSKVLKADVVVLRGKHIGSKNGDFLTEVEVKSI